MNTDRKSVYIESTIPSYATAKTSRDILKVNRQTATRIFWENERQKYDLFISEFVIEECGRGDPDADRRRLDFIKDIEVIPSDTAIDALADVYFNLLHIPLRAKTDCFHLAVCIYHKIDYLLSWNCSHLGNKSYAKIITYNNEHNLWVPYLETPDSLMLEKQLEEEEDVL